MLRSSLFRFVGYLLALYYLSEHLTIISLICQFRIHYYFSFVNIQEKSTFISNKKECELIIKEWKTFSVWGIDQTLSKMFPDISNPTLSGKIVFLWRIINFQKIYSEERYILDISTHRRLIDWSPLGVSLFPLFFWHTWIYMSNTYTNNIYNWQFAEKWANFLRRFALIWWWGSTNTTTTSTVRRKKMAHFPANCQL